MGIVGGRCFAYAHLLFPVRALAGARIGRLLVVLRSRVLVRILILSQLRLEIVVCIFQRKSIDVDVYTMGSA